MNCVRIVNLNKQYGWNRLYLQSFLTGLLAFVIMYVPVSIKHDMSAMDEFGIFPLLLAVLFMPFLHVFMHMLPLIMMNKQAKLIYKQNMLLFSNINYYTKKYVSKNVSLLAALAPTLLITIPGMIAAYSFSDYYVYFLIFTSIHIGMTFTDFLYILYIAKAPKEAYIENSNNEIAILIKSF
ncbi:hypothetical protein GCM10008983_14080 [Lentibacillus halophilus]|uniref:Zincin peptidase n=1 Tax=Lentibacillus halophilus TaxID=295065 RepID=A0ABN0Z8Q8_9BACI